MSKANRCWQALNLYADNEREAERDPKEGGGPALLHIQYGAAEGLGPRGDTRRVDVLELPIAVARQPQLHVVELLQRVAMPHGDERHSLLCEKLVDGHLELESDGARGLVEEGDARLVEEDPREDSLWSSPGERVSCQSHSCGVSSPRQRSRRGSSWTNSRIRVSRPMSLWTATALTGYTSCCRSVVPPVGKYGF